MRLNHNLLRFTGLFLLLSLMVLATSGKYLPLLLTHTLYYCQSLISSFSFRLPGYSGVILLTLLLCLLTVSAGKLVVTFIRVQILRKKLTSQITSSGTFRQLLKKTGLGGNAFLVKDNEPFAYCFGIKHPQIYISTTLASRLTQRELTTVLLHEKYHLENRDTLTMFVASMVESLFPFFPLISDLINRFRLDREIRADQVAVAGIGQTRPLVSVLKKFILFEPPHLPAFASTLAESDTLEIRINALLKRNVSYKKFSRVKLAVSVLSSLVLTGLFIAPVRAVELHHHEGKVMMVCLQDSECTAWCKAHSSVQPYTSPVNTSYPHTPLPR